MNQCLAWIKTRVAGTPSVVWFAVLIIQLGITWCFVRYVHYDRQNHIMEPEYYDCEILSADEFAVISDPANRVVRLPDGGQMTKSEVWETIVLPNYKPIRDGNYWVLVTTKGTGHLLWRWQTDMLPILMVALLGFLASWARERALSGAQTESRH